MKLFLTFSILFISLFAFSQSDECGTDDLYDNLTDELHDFSKAAPAPVYLPPWFGNNQYLYDILKSKNYFNEPVQDGLKSLTACNHPVDYILTTYNGQPFASYEFALKGNSLLYLDFDVPDVKIEIYRIIN